MVTLHEVFFFSSRRRHTRLQGDWSSDVCSSDLYSFELFAAVGIPVVEQALARAPDFAHSIPYPVAVKVMDAGHKTEAGGVALGVAGRVEFEARARKFGRDQILVQKMERGLAEAIVGYRDDPVVGPIVLVGAGGTLAQLYKDFVVELAPVSPDEAMRMIEKVKGLAVIRGYRNLPRVPADRKSTRLNSSHLVISYAVFCLKKKKSTARRRCGDAHPCPHGPAFGTSLARPQHHRRS